MTMLVVLTVLEIVVLIAALAFYLFWAGTLLARIATNLEECAEIVRGIVADAALIGPGVEHINETGGVVAGALPLLYGMAEEIVADVTPQPERPAVPEPARPASGTRRSRLLDAVGFAPRLSRTAGWSLPTGKLVSADRKPGWSLPTGGTVAPPRSGALLPASGLEEAAGFRSRLRHGAPGSMPSPLSALLVSDADGGHARGQHAEQQVRDREYPFVESLGG
jgi:hypothetical protein